MLSDSTVYYYRGITGARYSSQPQKSLLHLIWLSIEPRPKQRIGENPFSCLGAVCSLDFFQEGSVVMGRDISLKPVELFGVAHFLMHSEGLISLLLMSFEGLISLLPGFLDHLNFDFSIDKTFMPLDILANDSENVLAFRPKAFEEPLPTCGRPISIYVVCSRYSQGRNTCLPEEPHCLIMKFNDFCVEKTQVVGYLVAAPKDLRYIVKLWKRRSNFMKSV